MEKVKEEEEQWKDEDILNWIEWRPSKFDAEQFEKGERKNQGRL